MAIVLTLVTACRPSDAPPTLYQDLGSDDRPLLPTGGAVHDSAVVKGSAEWHPFRKPGAAPATAAAQPVAKPGGSALDGELRGLLKEFNDALAGDKIGDAIDFLIEEQLDPAKKVVDLLPRFGAKLSELAAVLPGDNEQLKKLPAALAPATVLRLDAKEILPKGDSEALADLVGAPQGVQIRFVLIKEEGGEAVWYIDHPQIRAMGQALPAMENALPQLDALIAGIKSGQIAGEALAQQSAALNQMLKGLMPGEPPPAAGEGN